MMMFVDVADSAQRMAARLDAQGGEPPHRGGHHPLTARLVDGRAARLGDGGRQAGERAADRRHQAHRPPAHHEDVDHAVVYEAAVTLPDGAAAARAAVSQRIRTVSSAALSTVNAPAVIHAEPVSGSAKPSM